MATVAADAARVIGAGNGAVDTASSNTSGTALDNLTRMTQAQVVAQGTAATALQEGTAGSGLTDAVSSFTGANLSTQVEQAVAGIVVPSRLEIAATDAAKAEGDSGFTAYTFTVTRSGSVSGALTVDWQVSGSDTLDGTDFGGALPGGKVTFADGETTKTITVSIAGDQTIEADETFSVQLSNPTVAAALVTDTAFGVILNDDPAAPQITLPAAVTALVGEATAITGLTIADGNSATVTVSLTPVNGSVSLTGPATISASGSVLSVTGSVADVNATLATLRFTGSSAMPPAPSAWRCRTAIRRPRTPPPPRHLDPVSAGKHAAGPPDRGRGRVQRDLRHQRRRHRQRHPDSHPDPPTRAPFR